MAFNQLRRREFFIGGITAIGGGLLFSSAVRAQTAGEMLHACELLERGMHVEKGAVYIPPSPEANQCWGFISAVQEYATLADQDGKTLLNACPNPDGTTVQTVHLFVEYARTHPAKRNLSAAAVAYNAMADAFPCK